MVAVDSSIAADSASASEPGSADAGSTDAVLEAAPPDAPPDVATCTTCPLVVRYMTPTTTVTSQEIRPHVEIVNNGSSTQDMTVLTLRYYFTADGSTSLAYDCDYALLGCGLLTATFQAMATPTATADHYMEISFTGGSIAAGSSTGDIQTRFHDTNFAVTFTQTNDYSFNAADTAYTQSNQITLYQNDALVWGVEP
jgi:cellulose 1,4-beta-cellobiosidase